MTDAMTHIGKTGVLGELGHAEHRTTISKLTIIANSEHQTAVTRCENLVRDQVGVRGAHAHGCFSANKKIHALICQPCDLAVVQWHIDMLPLPGRVVRDSAGHVARIVETTDASAEELATEEGNTGLYLLAS